MRGAGRERENTKRAYLSELQLIIELLIQLYPTTESFTINTIPVGRTYEFHRMIAYISLES